MQRREFLKSGIGAGIVMASAGRVFGANAPSNRVRLGVMGCHAGGRGFSTMQSAGSVPGVEIAAVCDVDSRAREAAAAKIKEKFGNEPVKYTDIRKMLEDKTLDGIVCSAPDHWHAPAAWMAMNAGKAIYVEKPCAFCPRETEILVETQKRTGMVFQVGSQRRSSTAFKDAIAEIRAGAIGEPHFARTWYATDRQPIGKGKAVPVPEWLDWDLWQGPAPREGYRDNIVHYTWHWFKKWGTGECGNNAPHFVDAARWALDVVFPERVTCGGGRLFYGGDDWQWYDTQQVTWEFPGKKVMTWEGLTSVDACPIAGVSTGCMVYGLKGCMLFKPDDSAILFDKGGEKIKEWKSGAKATNAAVNRVNPIASLDYAHFANFADAVRAKNPALVNAPVKDGTASTLLTLLGNVALECGETLWMDPATGQLAKNQKAGRNLWSREYEPGWEMK